VSHTVLICDDAVFMRTMISDILEESGYEIVGQAESGIEAIERYKSLRPDLVTMDIVMPDMGGHRCRSRDHELRCERKILMCSAMGQQALVVEAIQAGRRTSS
jgi:Response regulator containing a CheY-like receiver domain and an HTH DNA-binding domain